MLIQWQYTTRVINVGNMGGTLAAMGKGGWELCGVYTRYRDANATPPRLDAEQYAYFKRPLLTNGALTPAVIREDE